MSRLDRFFSKNWKFAARIRLDIFLKTQQVAARLTFLKFAARLTLQLAYGFFKCDKL